MYVIVVGGGKIGYYLTRTLIDGGHEVFLIEKDRKRAQLLAPDFGELVMRGDGCEVSTLQEAGIARAGAVVAVTGHDEDNLITCQLAKRKFQVPRTIARINNPKNEGIFRRLGIDATVSSTQVIYSLIEQEVESGVVVLLAALERGKIEIVAVELTDGSPAAHRTVKDVHLPGECVLAAILRDEHILLPSGTTELLPGDTVVGLTHLDDEPALRAALVGTPADSARP